MMRDRLKANAIPFQYPLGAAEDFNGIVDLVSEKLIKFDEKSKGVELEYLPIPDDMKDDVAKYRAEMIEAVVEADDDILHKYLESHELTNEEIKTVARKATLSLMVVPVFCGSAFKNKGVQQVWMQ